MLGSEIPLKDVKITVKDVNAGIPNDRIAYLVYHNIKHLSRRVEVTGRGAPGSNLKPKTPAEPLRGESPIVGDSMPDTSGPQFFRRSTDPKPGVAPQPKPILLRTEPVPVTIEPEIEKPKKRYFKGIYKGGWGSVRENEEK